MSKNHPTKKDDMLLGIDYGGTNIGLAFGHLGLVSPLKILSAKNTLVCLDEIYKLVVANKIDKIVVGLPLTYDDKETSQAKEVRRFANIVKVKVKRPIVYVNEYKSSAEAIAEAVAFDVSQKGRREIDQYSAALILKRYFDQYS